jgi:hypothetical protein
LLKNKVRKDLQSSIMSEDNTSDNTLAEMEQLSLKPETPKPSDVTKSKFIKHF